MRLAAFLLALEVPASQDSPLERLVEHLHSDRVEERDHAEIELKLRGDTVLPLVTPLRRDPDREVATRARSIVDAVEALRPVTPALSRAIPDARRRLASSDPRAWTRVFLEAADQTGAKRRHPALGREDLLPLAARALRGAQKGEAARVCAMIAAWQLRTAVPELVRWLDEPDWNIRQHVFDAVESCKARDLAPALLERYRREPDSGKAMWLGLLARLGYREIVPDIAAQLLTPREESRGSSLGTAAFGYLAQLDGFEAVPALVRLLRQGRDVHEILPALSLLAPDEIMPALNENLSGSDRDARYRALQTLALYFPARGALPQLLKAADDPDPAIRSQALMAMAHLRMRDLLPEFRKRLDDPAVGVRRAAAQFLAGFGDRSGLPELVLAIRHPTARTAAMYAIRRLGAREAADELLPLLEEPGVRGLAADVLGALQIREARGAIVAMLKDPDVEVRRNAAVAIMNLDGAAGIPSLLSLLDDPDSNVQWTAARMLSYLKAKEAVPRFAEWARSTDPSRRYSALWHLSATAPEQAVPVLIRTLDDPEAFVRMSAADHLARLNRPEAAPLLKVLLRDPKAQTRRAAATALVWLGDSEGVSIILKDPHYPRTRFELNLLRRPEVCRAWREKLQKGPDLEGSPREQLEELCRRAGITLEVSPDIAWPWQENPLPPDGGSFLTAVSNLLSGTGGAVVEEGRLRVMAPREGRRFWIRWWAEELVKSARKEDRDEGKELLAELDLSESGLQAWEKGRAAVRTPSQEEVRASLTPALMAVPGLEERLVKGGDEAWTKAFLHAAEAYARPEYKALREADFEVLGPRAVRGALSAEELQKVLQVSAYRKLRSVRPLADKYLTHAAASVRVQAAHLILAFDGTSALPRALGLLDDPDGQARKGIVGVLGALRMAEAGPEIMARKDDPSVLSGLFSSAADLDLEEAIPLLLRHARRVRGARDDYSTRIGIGFQLMALGNPSIRGEVRECLKTEDHPNAVSNLLSLVRRWGAREAIPEVVDLIANRRQMSEMYIGEAFSTLAVLGAREEAPTVLRHLEPERFHPGAAEAAGLMGLPHAVAPLRKLLAGDSEQVLPSVALALGRLGDRGSLERLRALSAHKSGVVSAAAAYALALLRDRQSDDRVIAGAGEPENYSQHFCETLALIGSPKARAALARRMHDLSPGILSALSSGGAESAAAIRPLLDHEDVWTRWRAVHALGRIEIEDTLADLRRMLKDQAPDVRQVAAQMLCRRGMAEGVPGAWEQARGRYAAMPFALNGVRSPEGWARLRSAKLTRPFYGPAKELMEKVAAAAGLPLEDLPADSREYPAWANVYVPIQEAELPLSVLEAVERMEQTRWMAVLESDRIRILPRKEALALWKEWSGKEKR